MSRWGIGGQWTGQLATAACLAGLVACGGRQGGATQPDEPVPFDSGETAPATPATNAKVQAGIDAIEAGDYAAAKAALTEATAANPEDAQAPYYLGVALEGLGETEAARAAYEKAISVDGKLVEARINLSGILIDAGDGARGLTVVEEGLQLAPDDPALLMNHALALELVGDRGRAVAAYAKAVEKNPGDVTLRYAYAENLAQAGKTAETKAELAKVLGSTKDPQLTVAAAQLSSKVGDHATCVRVLDGLIEGQATPDLYVRRGRCKAEGGEVKGAEADYRAALAQDANFAGAHYYLGVLLQKQGKTAAAKQSLNKAVETGKETPFEELAKKALAGN